MASPTGSAGSSQPSSKPPEGKPATDAAAVKKIGKYEIQKKIGAGGMGAVYLALDPFLKRSCALKVLPKEKARNPTLLRRFKAEAQAAANLRHENIVTVFEADEADGFSYIALEYVEGTDVARLVEQRGVIPLKRSIEIVQQVARALEHAHQKGIVHRDIKPGNLLVRRDGVVKLADLGLARVLDENTDTSITRAGTTVGTVDYMSPEQARDSKAADVRSDIYSLGCTWYYMLTGQPPFPEGSLTNKLRAHAETPLPDPRSDNPAVSEAVVGVMRRMTEKKAGKRYQTPAELLADLDAALHNSDIVSDTILSELGDETEDDGGPARKPGAKARRAVSSVDDDGPALPAPRISRPAPKSDAEAPAFRPPPGRDRHVSAKDKLVEGKNEKKKRNNAAIFYVMAGLLLVGAVVAIIEVVKEDLGKAPDLPQSDRMGNPFANRDAVGKAAGNAPDANTTISGTGGGAPGAAADQAQPQKTTISSGGDEESSSAVAGGPTSPGVDSGRAITRISSEGGVVKTETIGGPGGTSAGGPGAATGSSGTGAAAGERAAAMRSPARMKQESAFFPGWVQQPRPTDGLPILTVQPGGTGEAVYGTLNQAFEQAPASGAVIQLAGGGPFPLYPVKIADKTRIVIEPKVGSGAAGIAPLVVLLPPEEGSASNFIEFANTAMEFRGVHLALDASGFSTDPDDAMLSAISSDVLLDGCSLSVKGIPNSPMTALKIAGKGATAGEKSSPQVRASLQNTLIRGNNLTGLAIDTEHLDLALGNSLIWSGNAAAIRFASLARSDADSGRNLYLASTTVCSQRCAVQLAGDASHPVPTTLTFLNSLVAGSAGSIEPVLLELEGWNPAQVMAALGKFVNWKATDSLFTGWSNLIQLDPGAIAAATTPAQWRDAWKNKASPDKNQFQPARWPATPIAEISNARAEALAPQTIGKQHVKTSDGGWPGCLVESLVMLNLESLEIAQSAASRPAIPAGMFAFNPRDTIRIDVTRDDLGRKIAEHGPLQNGTQIIAAGYGSRQSSPIVIENAWVRLTFEQTDGAPLVLTPRHGESKHDGFISVTNGGIEIVAGAFSIPASERQPLPKWFIHVVDGDLGMWRCRVQGPLAGTTRNRGLIRWERKAGTVPERMFEGSYAGYVAISDSFLIGSGTLLDADMQRRALFFRNTIAVSRNDLLELGIRGQDSQIGGVVDLYYSTFSAAERFVHVEGAELGSPTNSPLAIYADRCVFGPPLRAGQQKVSPTLLSYTGAALEQRQISWWENRCGYAADIASFLRADDAAAATAQEFDQAWLGQWGAAQVANPLLGVKGVVLKADLPTDAKDRARLEPGDFQLHASCKAAQWDGSNHPIGAYVEKMQLPPMRGSGTTPAKARPAKTQPPATNPVQGF